MPNQNLHGKTALVTGASSGLGVDFARELAMRGCNLVLVARREEALRKVQVELEERYKVKVTLMPMDLSVPDAPQRLFDETQRLDLPVDVLVNNAGFGLYGRHTDIPWESEQQMLQIDIMTVAHLTKLYLPQMLARNFGYILMLASIGAYQPSPTYASYSAAKSFVLNLGEALNYELRKTGVGVTVLSPGVTATEFLKVAGQQTSLYQRMMMMRSEEVARVGINSMLQRRPGVVTGFMNSLTIFLNRFIPRRLSAWFAEKFMTVGQSG
jgi:short-subunit dehydrogenase